MARFESSSCLLAGLLFPDCSYRLWVVRGDGAASWSVSGCLGLVFAKEVARFCLGHVGHGADSVVCVDGCFLGFEDVAARQ